MDLGAIVTSSHLHFPVAKASLEAGFRFETSFAYQVK
jgi:hypothetical protein